MGVAGGPVSSAFSPEFANIFSVPGGFMALGFFFFFFLHLRLFTSLALILMEEVTVLS